MKWVILISVLVLAGAGTFIGYRATQHHGLDCYTQPSYTTYTPGVPGKGALPGGGYDFGTPEQENDHPAKQVCK